MRSPSIATEAAGGPLVRRQWRQRCARRVDRHRFADQEQTGEDVQPVAFARCMQKRLDFAGGQWANTLAPSRCVTAASV